MQTTGAALAAAILILSSNISASAQKATPEMFGALPTLAEAAISPDGKTVAMLQHAGGVTGVLFQDLEKRGSPPAGVRLGAVKARGLQWADDGALLLLVSQARSVTTASGQQTIEFWRWVSISRKTMKATTLLGNEGNFFIPEPGRLASTLPGDSNRVLMARWSALARTQERDKDTRLGRDEGTGYSLLTVRLDSGSSGIAASGDESTVEWIVDDAGRPALRVDYNQRTRVTTLYGRRGDSSRLTSMATIQEEPGGFKYGFVALADAPGKAVATTASGADKRSLVEIDLETGEPAATLFSHQAHDIASSIYDPVTARVVGVTYTDDMPRMRHFDGAIQRIQEQLTDAIPGAAPMIETLSADRTRMTVRVKYSDHPDQIFLFDSAARELAMLAPTYGGLDGEIFAAKEKYDYTASDGLAIPGYLTVPAGADKKRMPLIVLPHGGPSERDDQSFDWWAFFYAARGYLVYQPNFRGSHGYGWKFKSAGFGEWGRKMQDDITEGVKKLIADGLVDPSRVCIVGASYGGYAALVGATQTPDLYACSVAVNAVTNLPDLIGASGRDNQFYKEYWESRVGNRYRDLDAMRQVSPAHNAGSARAPILLIVSRDDTVVPVTQSRYMKNQLEAARRPHEFVELRGEDHWLSSAETRIEMLARSIDFIDRHIGAS